MRILKARIEVPFSIFLLAVCAGCEDHSNGLYPVQGSITLDGKPLGSGTILTSLDDGRGARGAVDSQGHFSLETPNVGPGALPGVHHVAVRAYASDDLANPEAPSKLLVPQRYTYPENSGLTIQVKPQTDNQAVLELTSKQ